MKQEQKSENRKQKTENGNKQQKTRNTEHIIYSEKRRINAIRNWKLGIRNYTENDIPVVI